MEAGSERGNVGSARDRRNTSQSGVNSPQSLQAQSLRPGRPSPEVLIYLSIPEHCDQGTTMCGELKGY